jgi:hypothetical protein
MRARSKITSAVFGVAALAAVTLPAVTAAVPASAGTCGEAGTTKDKVVTYNCATVEVILQNEPNLYGRFSTWEWGGSTTRYSPTAWYGPTEPSSDYVFNVNEHDACGRFQVYSNGTWNQVGEIACATKS